MMEIGEIINEKMCASPRLPKISFKDKWMKAILVQASRRKVSVLFASFFNAFCFLVSRGLMPRRGWSQLDVPSGWVQIIRGPRPRSVQWPRAPAPQRPQQRGQRQGSPKEVQQPRQSVQTGSGVVPSGVVPSLLPSHSPETVAVEAAAEVKQLETAIGVLGENNIHAKSVHEALRVTRNKTKLPPIQEQVESCKNFLERARKRVLRAQAVNDRAIEQKAVHESEVANRELRLDALAEGANPPPPVVSSLVSEFQ